MADATLDHLEHDGLFLGHLEPSIFAERLSPYHGSPPVSSFFSLSHSASPQRLSATATGGQQEAHSNATATGQQVSRLSAFLQEMEQDDGQEALLNNQLNEQRTLNGRLLGSGRLSSRGQAHRAGMVKGERRRWKGERKKTGSVLPGRQDKIFQHGKTIKYI